MEQRDFFISYTKADWAEADWIAETLIRHGYSVYIQTRDIAPADSFVEKMEEFMDNSRSFIAVWSKSYFDSYYAMLEFHASIAAEKDHRIKVIPICAEKCKPPMLFAHLVHADLYGMEEKEKSRRLLYAVEYHGTPPPPPKPSFPSFLGILLCALLLVVLIVVDFKLYSAFISDTSGVTVSDTEGPYPIGNGRNGMEHDYTRALEYYEQAADKGNAEALYSLGYLYQHGLGVDVDYAKAREHYEKAAEKGIVEALSSLGYLYQHGLGVDVDYTKARKYYEKATENRSVTALSNLGLLYEYGRGVPVDYGKAKSYYQRAIWLGGTRYAFDNLLRLREEMTNT